MINVQINLLFDGAQMTLETLGIAFTELKENVWEELKKEREDGEHDYHFKTPRVYTAILLVNVDKTYIKFGSEIRILPLGDPLRK